MDRARRWSRGRQRERQAIGYKEIERKDRQRQKEERWEKIWESSYNKRYKAIKGDGVPAYLRKGWGETR